MENLSENLSENIERYILSMFGDEQDYVTMKRKELAKIFECVPSQINYVLKSRFTPEHGYLIESRRGEYGYIKILKISCERPNERAAHIEDIIGDEISLKDAHKLLETLQNRNLITGRERLLTEIALRYVHEQSPARIQQELTAELLTKLLKSLMLTEEQLDD